jgi:hypothetical protein
MFRATPYPASAAAVGAGCQSGIAPPLPGPPVLTISTPILGANCVLSLTGAPYPAAGLVFASVVPASPTSIDGTCFAYLDLASFFQIGSIATNPFGIGSLSLPLPDVPSMIGLHAAVQALFLPAAGGYALTNGYTVNTGY